MIVQKVADVRPKKALIAADDRYFCLASSFLLHRHTGTSLNFCLDGFTH